MWLLLVNVVSTFSGCGGSSLGYKMSGFNVIFATDFETNAVNTYKMNFPKTKVMQKNIRELTGQQILKETGLKKGELDILDGSPPCTPFSMAGLREKGWNKSYVHGSETQAQRSDDLFDEYIRLIRELKPKIFIGENVRGLISGKSKGYFNHILRTMKKLGYIIRVLDIDAKDFGVPQVRRRIVFIGIRKDCFKGWKPLLTHKEITFRQATADLKPTKEEILESTPTDKNAKTVQMAFNMMKPGESASKYHPRKLYFGHLKLAWDEPSPTVICHSHQLSHPKEKRYLTLMECKRISSFPDDFKFTSRNDGFTRMGNSVPPALMKHISKYAVECSTI